MSEEEKKELEIKILQDIRDCIENDPISLVEHINIFKLNEKIDKLYRN